MSASSQETYTYELMCIYENSTINDEGKIVMSVHDHTLLEDEEFFASLFKLPQKGYPASQMSLI